MFSAKEVLVLVITVSRITDSKEETKAAMEVSRLLRDCACVARGGVLGGIWTSD